MSGEGEIGSEEMAGPGGQVGGKFNTRVLLRSDRDGRVGEEMAGPGGRVGGS